MGLFGSSLATTSAPHSRVNSSCCSSKNRAKLSHHIYENLQERIDWNAFEASGDESTDPNPLKLLVRIPGNEKGVPQASHPSLISGLNFLEFGQGIPVDLNPQLTISHNFFFPSSSNYETLNKQLPGMQ